jgi:hypothetical protein
MQEVTMAILEALESDTERFRVARLPCLWKSDN